VNFNPSIGLEKNGYGQILDQNNKFISAMIIFCENETDQFFIGKIK
jgi:hypothetical protein